MALSSTEQGIINHLVNAPAFNHETVRLGVMQNIILETGGEIMAHGTLYHFKAKRLCPGIYKLSLRR